MTSPPIIEQITRRGAASGRSFLWHGVAVSVALHVPLVLLYFGWNSGDLLDPVTPHPPERDYASISMPPSQAARLAEELSGAVHLSAEMASPVEDSLEPAPTELQRPIDIAHTALPAIPVATPPPADQIAPRATAPNEAPPRVELSQRRELDGDKVEAMVSVGALSRASSGVDSRLTPRVLINPAPEYPSDALVRRLSGVVLLRVVVDASGTVTDVRVVRSSGVPSLDQSALDAVRRWQFLPARDPATRPRRVNVPVEFVLRDR